MTTLAAVTAAIVAALAANLGTFDLSATDQVKVGTYTSPPGSVAFAAIVPPRQTSSVGQMRNTAYLETYEIEVRLWAPVTASTTGDQASRAALIAAEAKKALDLARDTGGNALWKCVRFASTNGGPGPAAATAQPTWAYATVQLTLTLRRGTQT